jgi:hypothetical protein
VKPLRAAVLVLAGVALGSLATVVVGKYSFPTIPLPALTAIITAAALLSGAGIERFFDLRARREERRANLLREVYFEAWDSLQRDLTFSVTLLSGPDPNAIQRRAEHLGKATAYAAKVYTAGSLETIRAFDELRQDVMRVTVSLGIFQAQQAFRRTFQEELDREIKDLTERAKNSTALGQAEAVRAELEEKRRRRADLLRVEIGDVNTAVRAAVDAGIRFEKGLPAAILGARRDLGFHGNEEGKIRAQLEASAAKAPEITKPLVSFMDELGKLVTAILPTQEKTPPSGDPPIEQRSAPKP